MFIRRRRAGDILARGSFRYSLLPHSKPTRNLWWRITGAVVLVSSIAAGALLAPPLTIRSIDILGTKEEAVRRNVERVTREVLNRDALLAGVPRLLLVSRDRLSDTLRAEFPTLATVRVQRALPGKLVITVQEKIAAAYVKTPSRLLQVTGEGEVLRNHPDSVPRTEGLPVIHLQQEDGEIKPGRRILDPRTLQALHEVIVMLPDTLAVSAEEFSIPSAAAGDLHIRTSAGWVLLIDTARSLDDQLAMFEKVISEALKPEELASLATVDLRIPGKTFYTLKTSPRSTHVRP